MIACVVGETQGGEGTHHLVQSGLRTDMAILPEPFGIEHLVTIHGGIVHLAIHTYGITGHLSQTGEDRQRRAEDGQGRGGAVRA